MNKNLENKLALNYWVDKLNGCPIVNDRSLTMMTTDECIITNEDLVYFNKLTANNEVVEFTVLLSIYNILLQRYFDTVLFIASSDLKGKEQGLLYKFDSINGKTLKQCLNEIKGEIQEVFKYSDFEDNSLSKNSLNKYTSHGFSFNGNYHSENHSFPFYIDIKRIDTGLSLSINYDQNFTTDYITSNILENIKSWLIDLETYINEDVTKLPILHGERREEVLFSFNNTKVNYTNSNTLVDLFEDQVKLTPNNVAVVFEDQQLSYTELNARSNQLANYLRETYDIQPDDLIGVKLERSEQLLVVILGILKSGAAYVPLDINYPLERINYIQEDSNCKDIIDLEKLLHFQSIKDQYGVENLQKTIKPEHLAYIIYTSGTTGKPKGVMIMHSNAAEMVNWAQNEFDGDKFEVAYASTSHCFDLSIYEMFYPLSIGKRIKILENSLSVGEELVKEQKVLINTVPSSIRNLIESGVSLDNASVINLAGEPFPIDIANKLLEYNAEIRNLYGPSEDTTYSTNYQLSSEANYTTSIPIGRAISNTFSYILDDNLEPLPIGVTGKLYLSGSGVAKGYLNKPEMTAERFTANPFIDGERMYDTGDLAKWNANGSLDFLGRKDGQVKIRGYRIELEEIENTITQFSDDIGQAVLNVSQSNNEKELVAYYVSQANIENDDLREFLQKRLPSYMIPSHFVALDVIPLTPNGKIDKKALPEVSSKSLIQGEYTSPRNEVQRQLAEIWQEVLGIEKVGIRDNFFDLGGHSLLIGQIINRVYKQLDKTITIKSFFKSPIIEELSKELSNSTYTPIPKIATSPYYPLTTSQNRIWVLNQLEGGNLAYNMSGVVKLIGDLDIEKFEDAFKDLIARHEILRTNFRVNESGEIHQYISQDEDIEFKLSVNSVLNQNKEEIDQILQEDHDIAFDLAEGLLLRGTILKTQEEEHLFSFTMHHIIGDGWSMELLISEVISVYNNLVENKESNLPILDIQYKDYTVWLESELKKEHFKASESYWLSQFKGELPIIDLPSFKNRPKVQTYNGKTLLHSFSKSFLDKLKVFSKSKDVTLFMTLMSGINALLYRYTNQNDIIVGTPIAGREHPELEGQIGLYLNTLAIRTQIEDSYNFLNLLEHQKQTLLTAYEHQNYPFDELVNKLNLKRDTSRSALFDVMVVLQNQAQLHSFETNGNLDGIQVEDYQVNRNTSQFDMSFTFVEKEGIELSLEYNTDIYDEVFVNRMFAHFEQLMSHAIDNPNISLQSLDFISSQEKDQLLNGFNNTTIEYPIDKTVVDIFEEQVAKTPTNVAIIYEDQQLTYSELNEQSNQLARYIGDTYTINHDDLVGIKLEKNEQLLVVIFGILKSGAAYVPIDINYPIDRIKFIEEDSNCKTVIDQQVIADFLSVKDTYSTENLENNINTNHLAYVIYTSGTTGYPKGVMVEHKNVVSIYSDWKKQYELDQFEVNLLQLASVSFDVFVGDICRSLLNGGKMILPSDSIKLNPKDLYELMEQNQVSLFEGTPGLVLPLLNYIKEDNRNYSFLKLVIFGSDSFNNQTFNSIRDTFGNSVRIINSYGVTEATIDSSFYDDYNPDFLGTTPIGKPFSNTKIYVLNEEEQLVPTGVFGTIYIGGAGVSRGYYKRPELTAAKFTKIPYQTENVYSTGDLARWLPDGNIEFLGRNDFQVKVRGYRIELGEIETALLQYSGGIENVVVDVKEINEEKALVSYYISPSEVDKSSLKEFLKTKLPEYMVPSYYIQLENFELTSNGKINRNALPKITGEDSIRKEYIAPRDETEIELVEIWEDVLAIEKIGVTDDFFELGGHSLKITKLRNLVNRHFGIEISFSDFFMKSTILSQSKLIKESSKSGHQDIPNLPIQDSYVLSSAQRRMWMLSQFEGGSNAYNMPGQFLLNGNINYKALEKAFDSLIERHEILRTRFREDLNSGEIRQTIFSSEENNFKLEYVDTEFLDATNDDLKRITEIENNYSFDLAEECLLRAKLIKLGENKTFLIFVIHHIVCDGWSLEIISSELFQLYNAYLNEEEYILQPLAIQYKEYASWEQDQLSSDKISDSRKFWENQFQGEIPVLELPTQHERPKFKTYTGNSITRFLSKENLEQLKSVCQSNNSTLYMGLVTVVKFLLFKYSNQNDIIVGTPIAGREHSLLQDQIGVYINTLALRTKFEGDDSFKTLLEKVRAKTLAAYEHQLYPFDKLVGDLPLQRDMSRNPLFDVMITLQNTDVGTPDINVIEGLYVTEYNSSDSIKSKFDIEFVFEERYDELEIAIVYNSDIFDAKFIEDLQVHLNVAIESCIGKPEEALHSLPFLTSEEEEHLINELNDSEQAYNKEGTILDLFGAQVSNHPNAVAVQDEVTQYSYKELDTISSQIAVYLDSNFENKKEAIGVMLDRSVSTIAILLGIMKSGRAYIPLDPTFPIDRLKYIINHSEITALISTEKLLDFASDKISTITVDEILSKSSNLESEVDNNLKGSDAAYIIYTSGSTGNPKGVEIGHRSLLNFLLSIAKEPGINNTDTLFAVTTYSFDISILEFFAPLISGASVYIVSNDTLSDPEQLIDVLEKAKPTIIQATPSFYQLLFNAGWKGDKELKVLCGGDALSEDLASHLLDASLELWNMYGPTETTIWSSIKKIEKANQANTIGKPIANTSLYVLDEFLHLSPKGSIGNLFIGGDGLAKGYYKQNDLTKLRFINNPIGDGLIYDTGDVVKWNTDGELVFLGRNDNQVKIRGYRIELGDIESKMNTIEGVRKAVVVAKKDPSGDSILIAYFTVDIDLEVNKLRAQLKELLPYYMIPSQFLKLENFPLTPNKKINRKELVNLDDINLLSSVDYIPANTEVEKKLTVLWQELLDVKQIGIKDNFFDLGGHSLSVTKLVSKIQKEYSIKVSLNKIFEHPVLEDQANLIENIQVVTQNNIKQDAETEFESFSI